jgi:hypothetical protein
MCLNVSLTGREVQSSDQKKNTIRAIEQHQVLHPASCNCNLQPASFLYSVRLFEYRILYHRKVDVFHRRFSMTAGISTTFLMMVRQMTIMIAIMITITTMILISPVIAAPTTTSNAEIYGIKEQSVKFSTYTCAYLFVW